VFECSNAVRADVGSRKEGSRARYLCCFSVLDLTTVLWAGAAAAAGNQRVLRAAPVDTRVLHDIHVMYAVIDASCRVL
jgi:hypothetical protein